MALNIHPNIGEENKCNALNSLGRGTPLKLLH